MPMIDAGSTVVLLPLLIPLVGVWVVTMVVAAFFKSRFSGLTGDTYGAINEIAEVFVLIFIILLARLGLV